MGKIGIDQTGKVINVENFICFVFSEDCLVALAVSKAENHSRECARDNKGMNKDGTVDIGIFQINAYWHRDKATQEELRDCKTNILVAKQIKDRSGWFPWVTYQTKSYLKYLNN